MKKILILCLLALSVTAQAQQYTLKITDVEFSNGEITDYLNATEKYIIIPDNFNDVAITSIGVNAFRENGLASLTIPNSVTSIETQLLLPIIN